MTNKIRVAIAGIGNCASALIQGIHYYKSVNEKDSIGLTAYNLAGYTPDDIEFVSAFDVSDSKVGLDLSEAIFSPPNNAIKINDVPNLGIKVNKGKVLDGVGKHLAEKITLSNHETSNVAEILKDSQADVLVNYLPVGSRAATQFYAEQCLQAGVSFLNAIPVFIASETKWQQSFKAKNLLCAGDDIMSQVGATVVHKTLVKLFIDRGVKVDDTYQLNIGGDMDFYNMLDDDRLEDKRISKTSAVEAMSPYHIPMRIGPSDFVESLKNDKVCYINIRGRKFGYIPIELDLKLRVADAYNSAGIMVDAIRATKIGLDRGLSGVLESVSAYCFKHPPIQMPYTQAKEKFIHFINGKANS
jgi:myo-inositol-1-phosphate synthase